MNNAPFPVGLQPQMVIKALQRIVLEGQGSIKRDAEGQFAEARLPHGSRIFRYKDTYYLQSPTCEIYSADFAWIQG